jgi:hypothetical protein
MSYEAPYHAVFSSLSTLFRYILNLLCSSLNVKDEVSHPYKKQVNLSFLYFNLEIFREKREMGKTLNRTGARILRS